MLIPLLLFCGLRCMIVPQRARTMRRLCIWHNSTLATVHVAAPTRPVVAFLKRVPFTTTAGARHLATFSFRLGCSIFFISLSFIGGRWRRRCVVLIVCRWRRSVIVLEHRIIFARSDRGKTIGI